MVGSDGLTGEGPLVNIFTLCLIFRKVPDGTRETLVFTTSRIGKNINIEKIYKIAHSYVNEQTTTREREKNGNR